MTVPPPSYPPPAAPAPPPAAPRVPRNPAPKLLWALGWLLAAVPGFVVFAIDGARAVAGDLQGQRTAGVVLLTPWIAVAVAVLLVIASIRGRAPWKAYVAQTTPQQRQAVLDGPMTRTVATPFLVMGLSLAAIWLAGVVVVLIFAVPLSSNTAGLAMALMLLALLALAWIAIVRFALQIRAAHWRAGMR